MSDLISRKWLMECVDEGWIKFDTEKDKNIYVHLVRDIAPSAQPDLDDVYAHAETEAEARYHAERKKGRWIPQDHNKTNGMMSTLVYYYPKCSVCGHCANYTNFCPNCGADMREPEDIPMEYFENGGR